jgi:misacylated tRNA(Ala) deacylase
MTKMLYMDNIEGNYIREFDALILKKNSNYITLDQTAFYPTGGGQPSDTGFIIWNNITLNVKEVIRKKDEIKHIIDTEKLSIGNKIHGTIDWNKRYNHMKMHTAQHILSAIIFDNYKARTGGNQIHEQYSRVDFNPVSFSDRDLIDIIKRFNEIISKRLPVNIYYEQRSELEKRVNKQRANLNLIPKNIKKLRIVEIEGYDICPCAGTHVRNTKEISKIYELKKETKGRKTERLIYSLSK